MASPVLHSPCGLLRRFLGGLVAVAGLIGAGSAAWAQVELVVPNFAGNSVTVYARTATGNVAPLRTLSGAHTGLASPQAVAVDRAGDELVVVNTNGPSVTVYRRTASGDTVPLRTLNGPATGLDGPRGMALDPAHGEIVVANQTGDSVTVYPRTAGGNTGPLRTLIGAATGLSAPSAVLVDLAHDELLVSNVGNNSVTVYPRTASGNTAPLRTLIGAATGLSFPLGLAVDPVTGQLLVANLFGPSVTAYPRTASGNAAPLRTLAGPATGLDTPVGLIVDPIDDELVVANQNAPSVTVYPREATGNTSPLRTLGGAATGLSSPGFLAEPNVSPLVSTGTGPTGGPHVKLFRFDTGTATATPLGGGVFAYDPAFTGGVQAILVHARGGLFLVTGIGSGGGPHIKLFRVTDLATGAIVQVGGGFFAYDLGFTGGARVAATTDPDGNLLIVTGVGSGGGPHVKIFRVTDLATGAVVQLGGGFFAYDPGFIGGVNVGAARAEGELVVPNAASNSVTVYARTASGNTAPLRVLTGAATGLDGPIAVALDPARGELLVVNAGTPSVTVYPRTASGNAAPLRTLAGAATGLDGPDEIVLDPSHGEIFVANRVGKSVTVYARTASGNAAPLRTLAGPATGFLFPIGILVDLAHDELLVSDLGLGNYSVKAFPRTASGNIAPLRTLAGAATGLNGPIGLALDPATDQLLVANHNGASVTAYARTASGNAPPLRTLAGAATGLLTPAGLVVDPIDNELVVTNISASSITVYPREATGNTSPLRTLVGAATGLSQPGSLAGPSRSPIISAGTGPSGGSHVRLFQFDTVTATATPLGGGFLAYDPGFTGGVQATLVHAQGRLFLVTGVGSGGGPHVKLFRVTDPATGAVMQVGPGFLAYDAGFTGGARVAATTDPGGSLLVVTGVGSGGGPHVKVFRVTDLATGAVVQLGGGFFAYDPGFAGGVNVGAE
jgi:6-phosphogluconolactonase (cycloisomerase 2 family)